MHPGPWVGRIRTVHPTHPDTAPDASGPYTPRTRTLHLTHPDRTPHAPGHCTWDASGPCTPHAPDTAPDASGPCTPRTRTVHPTHPDPGLGRMRAAGAEARPHHAPSTGSSSRDGRPYHGSGGYGPSWKRAPHHGPSAGIGRALALVPWSGCAGFRRGEGRALLGARCLTPTRTTWRPHGALLLAAPLPCSRAAPFPAHDHRGSACAIPGMVALQVETPTGTQELLLAGTRRHGRRATAHRAALPGHGALRGPRDAPGRHGRRLRCGATRASAIRSSTWCPWGASCSTTAKRRSASGSRSDGRCS